MKGWQRTGVALVLVVIRDSQAQAEAPPPCVASTREQLRLSRTAIRVAGVEVASHPVALALPTTLCISEFFSEGVSVDGCDGTAFEHKVFSKLP